MPLLCPAPRIRPRLLAATVALLTTAACTSGDDDKDDKTDGTGSAPVVVMTRNLFLGADLGDIIDATDVDDLRRRAAGIWARVEQSDIPARLARVADEIAAAKPDLVGLQEVEQFFVGPPDFDPQAPQKNASDERHDFLATLLEDLAARGLTYQAFEQERSNVELPAQDVSGAAIDVRIVDRDVILARVGVQVTAGHAGVYMNRIDYKVAGGTVPIQVLRGYAFVDAQLATGTRLTFGNTHLEVGGGLGPAGAFVGLLQAGQADQLDKIVAAEKGPLVLVGDFNSPADGTGTQSYGLLAARLTDGWKAAGDGTSGATCCADLTAPVWSGDQRIDLVLHDGDVMAQSARVVGTEPAEKTASGLWPSDHGGVVMSLTVRSPR